MFSLELKQFLIAHFIALLEDANSLEAVEQPTSIPRAYGQIAPDGTFTPRQGTLMPRPLKPHLSVMLGGRRVALGDTTRYIPPLPERPRGSPIVTSPMPYQPALNRAMFEKPAARVDYTLAGPAEIATPVLLASEPQAVTSWALLPPRAEDNPREPRFTVDEERDKLLKSKNFRAGGRDIPFEEIAKDNGEFMWPRLSPVIDAQFPVELPFRTGRDAQGVFTAGWKRQLIEGALVFTTPSSYSIPDGTPGPDMKIIAMLGRLVYTPSFEQYYVLTLEEYPDSATANMTATVELSVGPFLNYLAAIDVGTYTHGWTERAFDEERTVGYFYQGGVQDTGGAVTEQVKHYAPHPEVWVCNLLFEPAGVIQDNPYAPPPYTPEYVERTTFWTRPEGYTQKDFFYFGEEYRLHSGDYPNANQYRIRERHTVELSGWSYYTFELNEAEGRMDLFWIPGVRFGINSSYAVDVLTDAGYVPYMPFYRQGHPTNGSANPAFIVSFDAANPSHSVVSYPYLAVGQTQSYEASRGIPLTTFPTMGRKRTLERTPRQSVIRSAASSSRSFPTP